MRKKDGRETWRSLLEWDKGQAPSERLAGHILRADGFESIDPSHPLGGPDGLRDIVCAREGKQWIGAAYFPRGRQTFNAISTKFEGDLEGVAKNNVTGLAFVTNQELTLGQREKLLESAKGTEVELFHLERIASILDSPRCYGIRLDFLDIEMTKEEQLAFVAERDLEIKQMKRTLDSLVKSLTERPPQGTPNAEMPIVQPRTISGDRSSVLSGILPQPKECSSCHAIFLVDRSQSWTTASSYSLGAMTVITCPYCGHTERFSGWPFY
jgi:hypothetical protein